MCATACFMQIYLRSHCSLFTYLTSCSRNKVSILLLIAFELIDHLKSLNNNCNIQKIKYHVAMSNPLSDQLITQRKVYKATYLATDKNSIKPGRLASTTFFQKLYSQMQNLTKRVVQANRLYFVNSAKCKAMNVWRLLIIVPFVFSSRR